MTDVVLYIHWPWCKSKCNYCDFYNTKISKRKVDYESFVIKLEEELHYFKNILKEPRIKSIHIGGGTPSTIPTIFLKRIIKNIYKKFTLFENTEISIEVNPEDVNDSVLASYKKLGINRLSIGIQSISNPVLKWLNREHDREKSLESINSAVKYFKNISIDLIYGVPETDTEKWLLDLDILSNFPITHITLNEFSHKNSSYDILKFQERDFFTKINKLLKRKNFISYETSNFTKAGFVSKYNLAVFNMTNILGLGPSAHSRIVSKGKIFLMQNVSSTNQWLANSFSKKKKRFLNKEETLIEFLINGLKTNIGIDFDFLAKRYKIPIKKLLNYNNIMLLKNEGLLIEKDKKIFLSTNGRSVQNTIITSILI